MATNASRNFLIVLLVLTGLVVAAIIVPFGGALFMAAVLATTFHPWMQRLTQRLGGRHRVAASLLTIGVVIALVVPLVTIGVIILRESREAIVNVQGILEREGVDGLIRGLPQPLSRWADIVWQQLPDREESAQLVFEGEKRVAASIPRFVTSVTQAVGQVALMIVALYFLLLDGERLLNWLDQVSPLRRSQLLELLVEFRKVSVAVLLGSFVTAGAQSIVALIGYAFAHVPNLLLCTVLTFVIGLVPLLGAAFVSFAIAVYLLLIGHPGAAIFLAIWSVAVVGLVDNIIRPILLKEGTALHGAIVFFALLGGVVVFGAIGLILGPLSVSLFLALLRMLEREHRTLSLRREAAS